MKSYRDHTIEIISRFYSTSKNLKTLLNYQFDKYILSSDERNRIFVQTREILRWKGRIDWYIKKHLDTKISKLQRDLLALLESGAYEIIFDEKIPVYASINSYVEISKIKINRKASGLVNAVLRKISNENFERTNAIKDHDWYSFPNWLYTKWIQQFGKPKTVELVNHLNNTPLLIIRRNINKLCYSEFENSFDQGVSIEKCNNSECFYSVQSGGGILKHSESFKDGEFSFQDRAAGMIVEVLDPQPDEIILDVCCAPGTKTNYIAELMGNKGTIYASDINTERVELAKLDSRRLGNRNIIYEIKDAAKSEFPIADKILVDAPCTGTGTIGRRPDIKWRREPDNLDRVVNLQKSILNNVSKYLKNGGVLVYATCSLEREENWQVVEAFLKFNNDFKVVSIHNPLLRNYIDEKDALSTFPPIHKMDGMFAVKMKKNEN